MSHSCREGFSTMTGHFQLNLGRVLSRHARYRGPHTAIVTGNKRFTYAEFNARVNRLANYLLGQGVKKGDRVATVLPNCIEFLDVLWAATKIGAVTVPLSPLLNPKGVSGLLNHSGASVVFGKEGKLSSSEWTSVVPKSARLIQVGGEQGSGFPIYDDVVASQSIEEPPDPLVTGVDPMMIIYSSGTTGEPKGIVLSHDVRLQYCLLYAVAWRMTPESVSLHAGSLVFNGAYMTLMPSVFLGGVFVLLEDFVPQRVLAEMKQENVSHAIMVPSQLLALMGLKDFNGESLEDLQALISIGAPLPLDHKQKLHRLLPGKLYELYGLAEGFQTILDRDDFQRKMASVGAPPPLFDLQIIDEHGHELPCGQVGEIAGRGPILMSGYHNRLDLTQIAIVDGWLRSGDVGYVDEDGYLYLVDRKKDMIKSGGVGVYPRDIEDVVLQHPAVSEAAVFGVPHEKWGETPVAALVLKPGHAEGVSDLKDWINGNVSAKFQRVSDVLLLQRFPRNAAGKTLKRELRDLYLSGGNGEAARKTAGQ